MGSLLSVFWAQKCEWDRYLFYYLMLRTQLQNESRGATIKDCPPRFHQTSSWYGIFRFIAQTVISSSNVRNISK